MAFAGRPAPASHQSDWVHFNLQSNGATFRRGFWVKYMRLAEGERKRLRPRWVLAQQKAKVRRGLVRGCDRYYHRGKLSDEIDFRRTIAMGWKYHCPLWPPSNQKTFARDTGLPDDCLQCTDSDGAMQRHRNGGCPAIGASLHHQMAALLTSADVTLGFHDADNLLAGIYP